MRVVQASLLGCLLVVRGSLGQEAQNADNASSLERLEDFYEALDIPDIYRDLYDLQPKYLGCYKDVKEDRALPFRAGRNLGFVACAQKCMSYGFRYFGRQSAEECWCGGRKESDGSDLYAKHDEADGCDCEHTLVGQFRQCVYDVGHDVPHRLGCWKDKKDRALPHYMGREMEFEDCAERCMNIGSPVFGIQARRECWCGAGRFRKHGEAEECTCGTAYTGRWKQCVYLINDFQGCWKDASDSRAMEVKVGRPFGRRACNKACREIGGHFMGRQGRHECWCGGNSPTDYTWQLNGPSSDCDCEHSSNIGAYAMCVHRIWHATLRGCWADTKDRALPYYVGRKMSWDACHADCKAKGYYLMGRQAHGECWCGGSEFDDKVFKKHGRAGGCRCEKDAPFVGAWKQCVWRIPQDDTIAEYA